MPQKHHSHVFAFIDAARNSWKLLLGIVLLAIVCSAGSWILIPPSVDGQAVLQVDLSESDFKQASAIFYNPAKAREYFKRHNAAPEALGLVPNRLDKLSSIITPVYAYEKNRKLAETMPRDSTNSIILLNILLSGSSVKQVDEALALYGGFVRQTITDFRIRQDVDNAVHALEGWLLNERTAVLNTEVSMEILREELQSQQDLAASSKLPQSFTWTLPENADSLRYLPVEARIAGTQNMLIARTAELKHLKNKMARNTWSLRFFKEAEGLVQSAPDTEQLLKKLAEAVKSVFENKVSGPFEKIAMNNATGSVSSYQTWYDRTGFISPPVTPGRTSNLKIKVALSAMLFLGLLSLGVSLVVIWRNYLLYKKEH